MYYPLKLKKFTDKHINKNYIDEHLIERLMRQNMKECSFNTFLKSCLNTPRQRVIKFPLHT